MNKILLKETIREIITKVLNENAPSPSKPSTSPDPVVAPGKPGEKPKPRRPLGNPDVKPNPKAMNEEEMLNKIVARFKAKNLDENANQKYSFITSTERVNGSILNTLFAYPNPSGMTTKERIINLGNKTDSEMGTYKIVWCKNREEAKRKSRK